MVLLCLRFSKNIVMFAMKWETNLEYLNVTSSPGHKHAILLFIVTIVTTVIVIVTLLSFSMAY